MEISDRQYRVIQILRQRGELPAHWSDDLAARYLSVKAKLSDERLREMGIKR